jgi:serine/threonine protein kinase
METLGRYQLLKAIAQGGMSTVYLARDSAINRDVALKLLDLGRLSDRDLARLFRQEAQAIGRLVHPSIVRIYDVGQQDDKAFIVMEYVKGKSLDQLLKSGPVSRESIHNILLHTAEALDYAHQNGIVHRDIKPSNILIDEDGSVKVLDFGIARVLDARLTRDERVVGTLAYMSPEQAIAPRETGAAADEFSLAVVGYQMLTGHLPFDRASEVDRGIDLMQRIIAAQATPASHYDSSLSRSVDAVFFRALSKRPEDRFTSCREFVETLFKALGTDEKGGKSRKTPSGKQEASDRRRKPTPSLSKGSPPRPPIVPGGTGQAQSDDEPNDGTYISKLADAQPPTGFFASEVFPRTRYFADDTVRFAKIEESLTFYRDSILREYTALAKQADTTYKLWVFCVSLGFVILVAGILIMFFGGLAKGALTLANTVLVYFVQHIFRQREDHYRQLAAEKNAHLEYGNHWLLVIQSIDAIEDHDERVQRQTRLVDVLTEKLHSKVLTRAKKAP